MGIILMPLRALWELAAFVLNATGRLLSVIAGGVLMAVGAALSATVIGACVGLPALLFGFALVMRGLF